MMTEYFMEWCDQCVLSILYFNAIGNRSLFFNNGSRYPFVLVTKISNHNTLTFFIIPCCSKRSSSCPMASFMANGTGRGFQNMGVASGFTKSEALYGSTAPNLSEKSGWCCCICAFSVLDVTDLMAAILLPVKSYVLQPVVNTQTWPVTARNNQNQFGLLIPISDAYM